MRIRKAKIFFMRQEMDARDQSNVSKSFGTCGRETK